MQNLFPLLLFTIFLIFFIPFIFQPINENFVDKNNEKIFTLKNNKFKYNKKIISIVDEYQLVPKKSKIQFKYSLPIKFKQITDRSFTVNSNKNKHLIDVNFSNKPVKIDVNNDYEIDIIESEKYPETYNIIQFGKAVGSIKNNKIKSSSMEINNNPDTIAVIFTALKFMEYLQNHKNIDYDNYFLSNNNNV